MHQSQLTEEEQELRMQVAEQSISKWKAEHPGMAIREEWLHRVEAYCRGDITIDDLHNRDIPTPQYKNHIPIISKKEMRKRREAVDFAIANVELEGMKLSKDTKAEMEQYVRGEISPEDFFSEDWFYDHAE